MKISILGSGYVGLVTASCLSDLGHDITCIDKDKSKILQLKKLKIPFYESGLNNIIKRNVKKNNLRFSHSLEESFYDSEVIMIAVGTPYNKRGINLKYIKQCAKEIGILLRKQCEFKVVCIKSTVIPGTSIDFVRKIIESYSGKKFKKHFGLANNPEFLAEGSAVNDFMYPDRIVVGTEEIKSKKKMSQIYNKFKKVDKIFTNLNTAEFIKYASNYYFAMNISYANEISNITNSMKNVDAVDVLNGVHLDKRISPIINDIRINPGLLNFIHPGVGFGGSCFPKDLRALSFFSKKNKKEVSLLKAVIKTNNYQYLEIFELIKKKVNSLKNKKILVLGLSFKPNTNDIRESPSLPIIKHLIKSGAKVCAHDPMAIEDFNKVYKNKNLHLKSDLNKALKFSNIILLITSWPEYRKFFKKNKNKNIILIDGRRFIDKDLLKNYYGIGI